MINYLMKYSGLNGTQQRMFKQNIFSMTQLFFIVIILFVLTACDQKPKNPVAEYGDAMINSYKRAQQAGEMANLDAIKKAIQAYHAVNDKYPESLKDIEKLLGTTIDDSKYDYNPDTGMVSLKSH
jgi:hypothetical protein